jgi:putative transposase
MYRFDDAEFQQSMSIAQYKLSVVSNQFLSEVLRHLEIAESTWNRWRSQYGGMKATEARRLRELEIENSRLKRLLADAELDKAMLKELAEGNF